jgi:spore maturation protein CgeB
MKAMRIAMFYHSLVSDWNHGNAHFLRGIVRELKSRGQHVAVYEPRGGWSRTRLVEEQGPRAVDRFHRVFPELQSCEYDLERFDLARALDGVDLVLVHEWNDPALIARLGRERARRPDLRLLFHDTHHRMVTAPEQMAAYDLTHFDGVLAFGDVLRRLYLERGWAARAWTWHEAADARLFRPPARRRRSEREAELVWVGNWGDGERTRELHELLLGPIARLGLSATVHGVRYPVQARRALRRIGASFRGWLPNHEVPHVFARHAVTVHVPRRVYTEALPGIPTIRPFEALACGIPLVSAPWDDAEGLFEPGRDYLVAHDGDEMVQHLRAVLTDPDLAERLSRRGVARIRERHTCAHRVDELFAIARELGLEVASHHPFLVASRPAAGAGRPHPRLPGWLRVVHGAREQS